MYQSSDDDNSSYDDGLLPSYRRELVEIPEIQISREIAQGSERYTATIYVWSGPSDKYGHAALQTSHARTADSEDGIYASFYPIGHPAFLSRTGHSSKLRSLDWDLEHYRRRGIEPRIIKLSHLNTQNIEMAFREFISNSFNFSMLASSIFAKEGTQNCSGLIFALLKAGGAQEEISLPARMRYGVRKYQSTNRVINFITLASAATIGIILLRRAYKLLFISELESLSKESALYMPLAYTQEVMIASKKSIVGSLASMLYDVNDTYGNVGLGLCLAIVLIISYCSSASVAGISTAALITPIDILSYAEHLSQREATQSIPSVKASEHFSLFKCTLGLGFVATAAWGINRALSR